jgi:hypothetical protein
MNGAMTEDTYKLHRLVTPHQHLVLHRQAWRLQTRHQRTMNHMGVALKVGESPKIITWTISVLKNIETTMSGNSI